jgi:hypothetical protein
MFGSRTNAARIALCHVMAKIETGITDIRRSRVDIRQ